jgi:hypothetical protein
VKRFYIAALASVVAMAGLGAPAHAALSVPQIAFNSGALQGRLNGFGESINVLTQQQDGLVWGSTVSSNATMTIQFELAGNPHVNEIGIAALDPTGTIVTGLDPLFPSADLATGSFAVASFRPGGVLKVNVFDATAALLTTLSYTGVNRSLFSYYIKNGGGTFNSHYGFNGDGKVHALAFAGSGENTGAWWLAWEDAAIANYADADFDDALVFMESLNPTPVNHTSWGSVKARFR